MNVPTSACGRRVREAVAREQATLLDVIGEAVGDAMGELLQQKLSPLETKLADLERLLQRLRSLEREQPIDLPPLRSLQSRRDAH